jgi:hypothetical protein
MRSSTQFDLSGIFHEDGITSDSNTTVGSPDEVGAPVTEPNCH